jgi:hypothetical protein
MPVKTASRPARAMAYCSVRHGERRDLGGDVGAQVQEIVQALGDKSFGPNPARRS